MYYLIIFEKLSILVSLCVVSFFIDRKWSRDTKLGKMLQGSLFGIITVFAMLNPLVISKGLIFDGRSILISLSGLYFGFITGFITALMAIVCRNIQGGVGALTGSLVILSSFLIGILGYHFRKHKKTKWNFAYLILFGFVVHLAMFLLMFTLPHKTAAKVVKNLWIIILFIYPAINLLVAKVFYFQEKIKESEDRFKSLFYQAPIGIVFADSRGKAILTNKSMQEIVDYNEKELKQVSFQEVTHLEDLEKDVKQFEKLVSGEIDHYSMEKRYIKKDGSAVWCNLRVASIKDSEGGIKFIVSMVQDIDDRKFAEIKLTKSEKRFRELFENMQEGGQIIGFDWKYLYINASAEKHNRRPSSELLGKRVMDVWSGIDKTEVFALEKRCMEDRIPQHMMENEFVFPDGGRGWYMIDIQPVEEGIFILSTDITGLKLAQLEKERLIEDLRKSLMNEQSAMEEMEASYEELQAIQAEIKQTNLKLEQAFKKAEVANFYKTEFLANMSHEIRTPLTAILGYNDLMLMDKNLNDDQKENLRLIQKSGKRLMNLIVDILELSRIEAGKTSINKETVDTNHIIENLKDIFSLQLKSKGLRLINNLNGIKKIYTDPQRLSQILINIIGNSVKFTEKGEIKLELKEQKDYYLFSVSDTGIGISKELVERIFDSFIMGETGYTKRYEGAGLGLTICKRLIQLLGGRIWVESKLGKGSTFYFTLAKEEEKGDTNEKVSKKKYNKMDKGLNSLKIAIVDDEELILKVVEKTIRTKTNHILNAYPSASSFLSEFDSDYDLILMDIRMPVMNGVDCLNEIRKIDSNVPVIALTAFAMEEDRDNFIGKGFNDFISKPMEIEDFVSMINGYAS